MRDGEAFVTVRARLAVVAVILLCAATTHLVGVTNRIGTPLSIAALLVGVAILLRPGPVALRLGLLVAVTAFTVMLGDLVLRPLAQGRLYYRPHEMFSHRWPLYPDLAIYDADVRYRGETFGDLAAMHGDPTVREPRTVVFETDALGYRNTPRPVLDEVEVILLGDSFGVGAGASQEDIWSERLLREHGLASYSVSIPGSPGNHLRNLRVFLRDHPVPPGTTVLWAIFTGNDLTENSAMDFRAPEPASRLERFRVWHSTFRNRSPSRLLAKRLRRSGRHPRRDRVSSVELPGSAPLLFYEPYLEEAARTRDEVLAHEHAAGLSAAFEEMAVEARASALRVVVVSIPTKGEVYDWLIGEAAPERSGGFSSVIAEFSARAGFEFFDLLPVLRAAARDAWARDGSLLWWRDDTHWNGLGHAVAAQAVASYLNSTSPSE